MCSRRIDMAVVDTMHAPHFSLTKLDTDQLNQNKNDNVLR